MMMKRLAFAFMVFCTYFVFGVSFEVGTQYLNNKIIWEGSVVKSDVLSNNKSIDEKYFTNSQTMVTLKLNSNKNLCFNSIVEIRVVIMSSVIGTKLEIGAISWNIN